MTQKQAEEMLQVWFEELGVDPAPTITRVHSPQKTRGHEYCRIETQNPDAAFLVYNKGHVTDVQGIYQK